MVTPAWEPMPTTAIKLVIYRQTQTTALLETNQATIEEVVFPGYRVMAPRPERPFPELTLAELRPTDRGILASGANLTPQTVLVLDGTRLPTAPGPKRGQLLARLPAGLQAPPRPAEVYLTDGLRRSNPLGLTGRPPVLTKLNPASTPAGTPTKRPDGGFAFSVDCEAAIPGTAVTLDGRRLETAYRDEHALTAVVPRELLERPGRHTAALENIFGESNRLEFVVERRRGAT